MSLWSQRYPMQQGQPFPAVDPGPTYRSTLDRKRVGSTPDAEYPSGYLGAHRGRRDDLLRKVKRRSDQRDYERGVHHGSLAPPGAYTWPDYWNPQNGIAAQARGMRQTIAAEHAPEVLTNHGKPGMHDVARNPQVSHPMRPPWV